MNIAELKKAISSFLDNSKSNIIPELDGIKIYDEPIVGIASGYDPLFIKLKDGNVIGEFHNIPHEWFPEAVSVISYFLPFSREVRISNRADKRKPSTGWLYGRVEGELVNNEVRKTIAEFISVFGGKTFIPLFESNFKIIERKSNWSERHVAFIAGLGTFGLSKSLITEKGCAGRIGSVITNIQFQPTERRYSGISRSPFSMFRLRLGKYPPR